MLKAIVYRLYPSPSQQRGLATTLETCRHWYNRCLAERKDAYEQEARTLGKYEQLRQVKTYKATNPYATPVHSHVLQMVVSDLDKAFHAFFRRVKAGEKPGYPRFKGRNRFNTVEFPAYGDGCKLDDEGYFDTGDVATMDPQDGKTALFVLNRDLNKPHMIEVNWQDKAPARTLSSVLLTGDDLKAFNSFEAPQKVAPRSLDKPSIAGGRAKFEVPARSYAVIQWGA
jgi:transposase